MICITDDIKDFWFTCQLVDMFSFKLHNLIFFKWKELSKTINPPLNVNQSILNQKKKTNDIKVPNHIDKPNNHNYVVLCK